MKKRVKHCIESCRFIHLFLCFVLVSGECSAFALFQTVVKLIMLHYSCFASKNVQLQALFCRLQNVSIIIRKKVIQHLSASNKNGSPCIAVAFWINGFFIYICFEIIILQNMCFWRQKEMNAHDVLNNQSE